LTATPRYIGAQKCRPREQEHRQVYVPGHRYPEKTQDCGHKNKRDKKHEAYSANYYFGFAKKPVQFSHNPPRAVFDSDKSQPNSIINELLKRGDERKLFQHPLKFNQC
jgi:hypothetical protein